MKNNLHWKQLLKSALEAGPLPTTPDRPVSCPMVLVVDAIFVISSASFARTISTSQWRQPRKIDGASREDRRLHQHDGQTEQVEKEML